MTYTNNAHVHPTIQGIFDNVIQVDFFRGLKAYNARPAGIDFKTLGWNPNDPDDDHLGGEAS